MRPATTIKTTFALALAATLLTIAPAAFAHGNGHGRGHAYGHRGYYRAAYYPRPVAYGYCGAPGYAPGYAPAYYGYAPYRPARVVYMAPAPYVAIGTRIGSVNISAVFGPHGY